MTRLLSSINQIQTELNELASQKTLHQAQRVILSVINLLDNSVSLDDQSLFQLFTDSDGKIRANASWFYEDQVVIDRKATYKIHSQNNLGIDFKLYGITKPNKRTISWVTALTPNFEDETFNSKFNIGIDFVVPKSADKIIIILSNNYIIRVLELKGELTATYQEILAKWATIQDFSNKKETHSILWESFDLQPLNKKFYAGISERFILLRQHLMNEKIFDEKHASLFANRLIGRVIFCWFLDKKGVISSDQKYFDAQSFNSSTDYYRGRLESLFYRVLNTPISERDRVFYGDKDLFGKGEKKTLFAVDDTTPFLNGGLFEPRETDLFENNKLTFSKNYFDDLFEFLSGYNFTTDESTSQFQQVAIDPEMLGIIFENLLAEMSEETGEQARKAKGAFYTPREIVDYMCRESLKEYLKTKIPEDEHRDQRLYQLIDAPDKDFQDQDHNWRRDWKSYKDTIIKSLDELKILDPACGSGAFPIGMLQLLVRVYERLETRFDSYKTKLQIIEKNIYGVDIEPMAIEIARLRTWLSIIVDEESDSRKIKPLPNLEFKFVCANSLIDLDQSGKVAIGEDPELAKKLQDIRDAYFNTENLTKKKKLRSDYDKLINTGKGLFGESEKSIQLKTYRPFNNESSANFFNPEFMFGVISFGLVIGNPPYFVYQGHNKDEIEVINKIDIYKKAGGGKLNAFKLFLAKGASLLADKGILNFIFQNSFLADNGSKKIREFFLSEQKIIKIDSFPERDSAKKRVFEAVKMSVCIMFSINEKVSNYSFSLNVWEDKNKTNGWSSVFSNKELSEYDPISKQIPYLKKKEKIIFKKFFSKSDIEKIKCYEGELNMTFHKKFFTKNSKFPKIIKGAQVQRYFLTDNMSQGELEYVKEKEYLSNNKGEKSNHHKMSRIALQGITGANDKVRIIATLIPKGHYLANSCNYIIKIPDKYSLYSFLGILNSYLINWIFRKTSTNSNVNTYEISNLSFPKIDSTDKNKTIIKIEELVTHILEIKKQEKKVDTKSLEDQIDELVLDLYGLTDEEKKIIYDKRDSPKSEDSFGE